MQQSRNSSSNLAPGAVLLVNETFKHASEQQAATQILHGQKFPHLALKTASMVLPEESDQVIDETNKVVA